MPKSRHIRITAFVRGYVGKSWMESPNAIYESIQPTKHYNRL
jgi:hypothetical protein